MVFLEIFTGPQSFGTVAWILISLAATIFVRFWSDNYLRAQKLKRQRIDVPILNLKGNEYDAALKAYVADAKGLLQRGYKEFKHGIYQIWSLHGFTTVVSPDFLEELSSLPPGTIGFYEGTRKRMVGDYEWVKLGDPLEAHTILKDLTQNFGSLLSEVADEIDHALSTELPECKDWTPVTIQPRILRIVSLMTGRVFVGPELNRNEEWLHISSNFMMDIYIAGNALYKYSHFMRPFAARFLVPEIRKVWRHQATAKRLLVPIMEQRQRDAASNPNFKKPNDMIQWLMDNNAKEKHPRSFAELAKLHLLVCFSALHTSTLAMTHFLYDLAARPEYVEPLREEQYAIQKASNGIPSKFDYNKMIRMDSFMKESQRLNPPSLMTYSRLVLTEFTLSNGVKFTPGTYILTPAALVSLDDDVWESANEFRGFRFADLRSRSKDDMHKFQFTTITPKALHFGHGRQGCPGRFFASYELKAIFSLIIETFDIKLLDEKAGRPTNKIFGAAITPDESAQLLLRRRRAVRECGNELRLV